MEARISFRIRKGENVTENRNEAAPYALFGTIFVVTLMCIMVTWAAAFIITSPPRGFLFWTTCGFLTFIQFVAGMMSVNLLLRSKSAYRPSGATMAIVYALIGIYAIVGIISIIIFRLFFYQEDGAGDASFGAVLAIETVAFFSIALLVYVYDLHTQASEKPATENKEKHRKAGVSLDAVIGQIKTIKLEDDKLSERLRQLTKHLEGSSTSLKHSHGGGVGSWEGGKQNSVSETLANDIQEQTDKLLLAISTLQKQGAADDEIAEAVGKMEHCAFQCDSIVTSNHLG